MCFSVVNKLLHTFVLNFMAQCHIRDRLPLHIEVFLIYSITSNGHFVGKFVSNFFDFEIIADSQTLI
jgi:hypothetical protein